MSRRNEIASVGGSAAGWQVNGKTYGLPWSLGVAGFWYNKAFFTQAGITQTPVTMNDFYAAIDKLKAADIATPTVLEALRGELPGAEIRFAPGCGVDDPDRSGFAAAVEAARAADVAVVVVGDQAGLFGRGTVGEGNDRDNLELPEVQRELVEAVQATGTPVVVVAVTGRPYAIEWALGLGAAVQAFFPGEEGGSAVAGVLSGGVNASGRLPVSLPRAAGAQPYSYLHPLLGGSSAVTSLATEPALAFGHGLSYATFTHTGLSVGAVEVTTGGAIEATTGGAIEVTVTVTNTGDRAGADIVQLYWHDPVASVTRPVAQLLGYLRVELEARERAVVRFVVPTTRLAFSDRAMQRIVEPGRIELWVGPDCRTRETEGSVELVGAPHPVTVDDARWTTAVRAH